MVDEKRLSIIIVALLSLLLSSLSLSSPLSSSLSLHRPCSCCRSRPRPLPQPQPQPQHVSATTATTTVVCRCLGPGSRAENMPAARLQQRHGMQQHTTTSRVHVHYLQRGNDEARGHVDVPCNFAAESMQWFWRPAVAGCIVISAASMASSGRRRRHCCSGKGDQFRDVLPQGTRGRGHHLAF